MIGKKILKESLKVLILGSLISSLGGFALENVKDKILLFLPLVIILPALANMIGHAGIIFVSKITTYFYTGKLKLNNIESKQVMHLFFLLLIIFSLASVYVTILTIFVSYLKGFSFNFIFGLKMLITVFLTTVLIVFLVSFVAIIGWKYTIKNKIDPDDLLIPITTSIADLGSFILFSLLVFLLF